MKTYIIIIFILFALNVTGQVNVHTDGSKHAKETSIGNTFHFNEIKISDNLAFKKDMQTRIESDYSVFEFPLLLKYNITNKVSFLIGPKFDLYSDTKGMMDLPSAYGTIGIQYDVYENFLIEAKFNYRLTKEIPVITDYTFGSESSFTLGSKLKF
jgi:hypothetical protein